MSDHNSPEEVKKHNLTYMKVFYGLLFLTFVTVALTWFKAPVAIAITLAMIVATVKGSLVAGYFMHLLGEKLLVYFVLFLTAIFFVFLMAIPVLIDNDNPGYKIAPYHFEDHEAEGAEEGGEGETEEDHFEAFN